MPEARIRSSSAGPTGRQSVTTSSSMAASGLVARYTCAMLDEVVKRLAPEGLILRGGFAFGAEEDAPAGSSGAAAKAILLVGHGGSSVWPHFSRWRALQPAAPAEPLDTWSRIVIGRVAAAVDARAVFPSDRPYLPFQQWAIRAEGLRPSPLGILMHPAFGLWHAYRGALLFEDEAAASAIHAMHEALESPSHPCASCDSKPCLNACPVAAHRPVGFDYPSCLAHVRGPAGGPCRKAGCLDRNACPVGTSYRYEPDQQAFHMAAFAGVR